MNTCEVDWPMLISDVLHHIERNLDNGITGTDIAALKILTPIQLSISKTGGSYQNLNIKTMMKKESTI